MNVKNERLLHLHYMLADHWKALNQLLKIDPDINRIYTFSSAQFKKYAGLSSEKIL